MEERVVPGRHPPPLTASAISPTPDVLRLVPLGEVQRRAARRRRPAGSATTRARRCEYHGQVVRLLWQSQQARIASVARRGRVPGRLLRHRRVRVAPPVGDRLGDERAGRPAEDAEEDDPPAGGAAARQRMPRSFARPDGRTSVDLPSGRDGAGAPVENGSERPVRSRRKPRRGSGTAASASRFARRRRTSSRRRQSPRGTRGGGESIAATRHAKRMRSPPHRLLT